MFYPGESPDSSDNAVMHTKDFDTGLRQSVKRNCQSPREHLRTPRCLLDGREASKGQPPTKDLRWLPAQA